MTKPLKSIIPGFFLLICAATLVAQTGGGTSIDASFIERLIPFEAEGTGTGNVNASSGVTKGNPIGVATYTTTLSNALDSISTNGSGGFCIRSSGNVVLTTASGSVLYLEQVGLNCNTGIGGGGLGSNATNNGTFVINPTLSTGRFAGATGTGTVVTAGYGGGPTFLKIDGTIKMN